MRACPFALVVAVVFALVACPPPVSAQRLPGSIAPLHYDITVAPDLASAKFTGQVAIRVRLASPASVIVLNAAEITFRDVTISAAGKTQTAKVTVDPKAQQAALRVDAAVPAGEATIAIKYDGILNDDLRGLYLSRANGRRYAVTQLEATDARRMFPSFDEPAMKATFSLTAIVDAADRAISNGAIVSDVPGPGAGKHTITFETTPKMSTYLVALAVGDFECLEGAADAIPVRVCATPDKKHLTRFALEAAKQQVEFYNRYYSIKYPFKKLDIVAVPDFAAGAMENTAAIFYRETLLLAEDDASVDTRREIAIVLAHEIAHQWFGDLVTMQWWDDIWLNEGFANWMMSKPLKAWRPDWHVELDEIADNHKAMGLDSLRSTRPIRSKASTPAEIAELFDPIAYEKGAAVLRMLESWVGEEPFRKGINAYLDRFQYANARAEDFWRTLAEASGKPVDTVMATFVDQPGLPVVSIDVQCAGGAAQTTVSQARFVRDAGSGPAPRQPWQIPVCLKTDAGETTCEVLRESKESIRLNRCPAWVMGNAGGRGYYRVAATPETVGKLAADITRLEPAERIVVLSDELALVRAGRHDVGTLLDLAAGFGRERTAQVMETLAGAIGGVYATYTTEATKAAYRAWVVRLLGPALAETGLEPRASDTDDARALRATLTAVLGGVARDPKVIAAARALVASELDKPGSVEPTLMGVAVTVAATSGDASLYDRYLARARTAVDPEERYQYLLFGLTAFTDPALIRRTMDLALSAEVRSQDAKLVVARLLGNREAQQLAWRLVRDRWAEIQKKTGEFVGNTVIAGALGSFCDAGTANEITEFFNKNKVPDAERTLQQAIETVTSCARVADVQRPKLAAWLASH